MGRKLVLGMLMLILFFCTSSAQAKRIGPALFQNMMSGAGAGTLVGASAGLWSYGVNKNRTPQLLLVDPIYGFIAGSIAGFGFGILDISSNAPDDGYTVGGYIAAGTGMGAFMGVLFATVPWAMKDQGSADFYEGCIGAGVGGVIGGVLGLGVAILDFSTRSPEGDQLLSGTLGIQPELHQLLDQPEAPAQVVMGYKLLELNF